MFGFSQEFAEYRMYNEGDDPRFIDWNVYARTDRTYIKRFLGDTNSHLMILLDASASMGFGGPPVNKLRYAQFLSASLAFLAARPHDAVGCQNKQFARRPHPHVPNPGVEFAEQRFLVVDPAADHLQAISRFPALDASI